MKETLHLLWLSQRSQRLGVEVQMDRRYREMRAITGHRASDRQGARSEALARASTARARRNAASARAMNDDGPAQVEVGYGVGGISGVRRSRSANPAAFAQVSSLRGAERRERNQIFEQEGSGVYRPTTRLYERAGELVDSGEGFSF